MAMPPPQPFQINLETILKESNRIIKAHSSHFLALSVVFLLPISFSFLAYPYIYQLFSQSSTPTAETHLGFLFFPTKAIIFSLLYAIYVLIFSLLAISSVTYSVFHGFYGRPLKLVCAIKSAFTSFPRFLSTCLVSGLIVSGILLVLSLILISLVKATQQYFGFQLDFSSSPYFIPLRPLFCKIILICIAAHIQVKWTFAPAVVVLESGWGPVPLKRSTHLVRGMRRVAFLMFLIFGYWIGSLSSSIVVIWDLNRDAEEWQNWLFVILYDVFAGTFFVWGLLSYLAANTVFYVYSKALHGELVGENIAKDFPAEYVKLPFDDDDGKVPLVVSAV